MPYPNSRNVRSYDSTSAPYDAIQQELCTTGFEHARTFVALVGFGSFPGDWIATLDRLAEFEFDVLVPGHGELQRDRNYIPRLQALLTEVRRQVGVKPPRRDSLRESSSPDTRAARQ